MRKNCPDCLCGVYVIHTNGVYECTRCHHIYNIKPELVYRYRGPAYSYLFVNEDWMKGELWTMYKAKGGEVSEQVSRND